MMEKIETLTDRDTGGKEMKKTLVHDCPYMKVLTFRFAPGAELPIHSHDIDGRLTILVQEGTGFFLGKEDRRIPAKAGDVLVSDIREPHGVSADTEMQILVTIAPPI